MRGALSLYAAVMLVASCSVGTPTEDSVTPSDPSRGHLVLNGGGSKPAVVMEKFIELAGGPDANIVVFPTASELEDTGDFYIDLFGSEYRCTNVWAAEVHDSSDAEDTDLAARVKAADGIFFSGGDQRRITESLLGTPVGDAVAVAFRRGAVVGGTSAGTACQSPLMITGDGDFTIITKENVELWEGLGFFPGVITDQHFVARGRQNRLISVVLEHPELLGVGVDEATAVWVRPDRTFKVLGEGWVIVFDAAYGQVTSGPWRNGATALGVHGMATHVLLPGEVFDTRAREVVEVDPWPNP
jgi:cyanophycinase